MKTRRRICAVILALATLILPAIGCGPDDDADGATSTNATPAQNEVMPPPTPEKPGGTQAEPEADAVVITGDLNSIDWKSLVGQNVKIEGKLTVVDTYNLVRYGEVKVARNRLRVPTSRIDPNDADPNETSFEGGSNVAKVVAAQKYNDKAVLTIDDGLNAQNLFPPKLFPELGDTQPTVRVGSVITEASGRIVEKRRTIYLVPNGPLKWTPAERPTRPDVGEAKITVASFNVLNYFTTIDDGANNARGADTDSEFTRQDAKIVSAITALKADVVGLMEIENSAGAEERLITALNKAAGKDVFKGCGLPDGFRNAPGGADAIRVALIYRSDKVTPTGDVTMIRDSAFAAARTPIVQTFKARAGGKPVTVVVNHFKSKGGSGANKANKNKGDGQGAFNATRRSQALAIVKYVNGLSEGDPKPRVLVLGDLNAYQQEDPIDALRAGGFVDLVSAKKSSSNDQSPDYSYVYRGQSGSLDHALATKSLAQDVTGVAAWHINADEPHWLDYNEEYNPKPLFKPDPFRSSDHDPVLIGIRN
jgi:predicted extracellular nuclease